MWRGNGPTSPKDPFPIRSSLVNNSSGSTWELWQGQGERKKRKKKKLSNCSRKVQNTKCFCFLWPWILRSKHNEETSAETGFGFCLGLFTRRVKSLISAVNLTLDLLIIMSMSSICCQQVTRLVWFKELINPRRKVELKNLNKYSMLALPTPSLLCFSSA